MWIRIKICNTAKKSSFLTLFLKFAAAAFCCELGVYLRIQIPILLFPEVVFYLVTIGYGPGPWQSRFIFNLNMQFLSKKYYFRFRL
jgi:hypothetical protein